MEFAKWKDIEERLNTQVYFADPYCAWQKGTNENSNGLLREFYPKGKNLARVSEKTLEKNLALINARPKKILNYHTPSYLFEQELKVLRFIWQSINLTYSIQMYETSETLKHGNVSYDDSLNLTASQDNAITGIVPKMLFQST